jgi:peptide/nickel transport system ATP-binding protein
MTAAQPDVALLEVEDLRKRFTIGAGMLGAARQSFDALDGVCLSVRAGETLALVGESGCGKSTLARCLVRLHDVTSGRIEIEGADIATLSQRQMRPFRRRIQMVFQDHGASLNPRRRIGELIAEPLFVHFRMDRRQTRERTDELMEQVGLATYHRERFPHELSGGQRQRAGIARALAAVPSLIIADEPTSALDVSIRAQIINLFVDLQERLGLAYIFISHDLSTVRHVSNRVAVMYLGSIVETGSTDSLFGAPAHPYTEALMSAVPVTDSRDRRKRIVLSGEVPSVLRPPQGCRFHPRCGYATDRCRVERPVLVVRSDGRKVACHHPRPNPEGAG